MRRIITAGVLALALSCFGLHAQDPKTDLEIDNLKGNVSKISAYTKTVIEEWGEEKEVLKSLYCSYYNEKGFFTYRQYKLDDEPFYYGGVTKKYDYDASGKLVQVLFYMPKTKSNLTEINTDEPQVKAVYEYDNQGRIKYISYYQTESGKCLVTTDMESFEAVRLTPKITEMKLKRFGHTRLMAINIPFAIKMARL